ncbi:MAG: flippase-like domain-containing protein [Chloroflexi bacterium]|nr:flippase-like domain-containing protein [Chloroflexota bacterium]
MSLRRIPWSWIIGLILIALVVTLAVYNRADLSEAIHLLQTTEPLWVAVAFTMIVLGFVCAGWIYGSVLSMLNHRETMVWLIGTALVGILLNQAVPMGSVAAYAFLVAALRNRGFPASSVAVVAGTELLSWNGAALLMFSAGLLYLTLTADFTATTPIITAVIITSGVATFLAIVATRPAESVARWLHQLRHGLMRLGVEWNTQSLELLIEEIAKSRAIFAAQPSKFGRIIALQMSIFVCHAVALNALLYGMRIDVPFWNVLAAYGMSLIVSLFTILPGGGGAVEAALSFSLHLQGVPVHAALGSAILFRLLSFWMMLPIGAIFYRLLTKPVSAEDSR